MKEKIIQRLESLGYTYKEADAFAVELILDKVNSRICYACNIPTVPADCSAEVVDAVCGEFLMAKHATGNLSEIQLEGVVKAITEGDTKVEFATGSTGADEAFTAYMSKLATISPDVIVKHRRIVW